MAGQRFGLAMAAFAVCFVLSCTLAADVPLARLFDMVTEPSASPAEGSTFKVSSAPEPGITSQNFGFVSTAGTDFYLNGKPFYCAGTNAYYAAFKYIMSDSEVFTMMAEHAKQGATVLRLFASSDFNSTPDSMMPSFDIFNEESIPRLDLALAAANQNGIRLILTLGTFWKYHGGAQDWVDQGIEVGGSVTLFYTDATLRQYYKDWVQHIVTRTNTVTGQAYVDDPTIFSWELLNEPRILTLLQNGSDVGFIEKGMGLKPGKIICDWVHEMAAYIKSLDGNHLLSTGEEGWRTDGNLNVPAQDAWFNNGYQGVDLTCNIQTKDVDFATIHSYPDMDGLLPPLGYEWLADNFYKDRAQLVHSFGKPIMLEEYGQAQNFFGPRENLLSWIQERVNENGYACTLVWAVSHYSTDESTKGQLFGSNDSQGYVFGYDGDGGQAVLRQYAFMQAKTAEAAGSALLPTATKDLTFDPPVTPPASECTDSPPDGHFTCTQQADFGQCGQPWMQGFCLRSCCACSR